VEVTAPLTTARTLLALQETDQQLARRRRAYRQICEELDSEGGIPQLKESAEKARLRELEARVEAARYESDQAVLKEKVAKLEERLYSGSITNVRELTAIETEHNAARREYARVEEAIAPSRSAADEAHQRNEQIKSELAEREAQWAERRRELERERSRIGREYKKIGADRESASAGISEPDLAMYNSLLPRMGGVAVVKVDRGVCQGCRVRLPIGEITRIQNATGLVNCSSCGRILLSE
jgi:hypothetical protein